MIKEAAERLQVEERTVRYWIATGDLKAVNVSRSAASKKPRLRILEEDMLSFQALRSVVPASQRRSPERQTAPARRWV